MRVYSLCSGIGGIELGLHLCGPDFRPVRFVERDDFCRRILAERWPGVPIDANLEDCARVECDVLTAGFPCQPWSVAGKRKGEEDERWLWPLIATLCRDVGPRFVFLENVPGLVRNGLAPILADLATLGFDAEWGVFSCAALGASHRRERLFILAHRLRHGRQERRDGEGTDELTATSRSGRPMEHTEGERRQDGPTAPQCARRHSSGSAGVATAGALWAPGPAADWSGVDPELWPATLEPEVCGMVDGVPLRAYRRERKARLRALGNAVSPPVAAVAWRVLLRRAVAS